MFKNECSRGNGQEEILKKGTMGRGLHWLEGSGTFADQLQSVNLAPFSLVFLSDSVVNVVAVSVLI